MSQLVYRGNLSATIFPMLSSLQGRTVIVRGQDNTYVPTVTSQADVDKDSGIPQIVYAENVIPHAQGFQAVGYANQHAAATPAGVFTAVHNLIGANGEAGFVAITPSGDLYTLQLGDAGFIFRLAVPAGAGKLVYTAHVAGTSYIYISNVGCYSYDFITHVISSVTLTGLIATDILGVTSATGYLIAWTSSQIAWSSLIVVTDFTPGLATGAGGGSVEAVVGAIAFITPHSQGIFVYAAGNIVVGINSGNTRYPFNFKQLSGSGGCINPELTVVRDNSSTQYAYTTHGIQQIAPTGVKTLFPEVLDFLAGGVIETFNSTTNVLSSESFVSTMLKKITTISDRYLVISYGKAALTRALIYDLQQLRWGKLVVDHVDCFDYMLSLPEAVETPKNSLAFIQANGLVKLVKLELNNSTSVGVIILGKFQHVRARTLVLQEAALENIYDTVNTTCHTLPTLDGKTFLTPVAGVLNETNSNLVQSYKFRSTGLNHSILLKGAFHLVSLVLTFSLGGSR